MDDEQAEVNRYLLHAEADRMIGMKQRGDQLLAAMYLDAFRAGGVEGLRELLKRARDQRDGS